MAIASVNPATGETLENFESLTNDETDTRIAIATAAFARYRTTSFAIRSDWMVRAATILDRDSEELARVMTMEMGKTLVSAVAEVEKCAAVCRHYAEHAERILADQAIHVDKGRARVSFQPLGVILAVMPWNFPLWQAIRFAAPALMAGNVALLKHASNVPRSALEIERVLREAGFPEGAFQTLLVGSDVVERIIADPRVAAVTLTGSSEAGRAVAAAAGRNLKKSVLELGGSDPFVVMPSADLDEAVATAVTARMINNGQSCIAAKRFIIHERCYDGFVTSLVERIRNLRVGDPMDPGTDIGPLATPQIVDDIERQVAESIALGATCLAGGRRVPGPGNYYEPTVLVDVPPSSPAANEELFGPVASVFRASDLDDAVRIANSTQLGLGASIWTRDRREQSEFIRNIESGFVSINGMVASDPRLPFGGVKDSGYGRELGDFGIREFVNIKTIREADSPTETSTE